ncbi:MAG: putative Ig domain-containing protein, partial [Armatimonadetes bacterium]|nr:putative Ig domain-containing protein [Akkermansiaceae bacterium]
VNDDEPSLEGVTPGSPNNPANLKFITRIRTNTLYDPPTFSLPPGVTLPEGLVLNPRTGLISGIISASVAPGAYPITIQLTNALGEVTSQTIIINVSITGVLTYSIWIGGFDVADASALGNSDFDTLPNLVEYALDSLPADFDQPTPVTFAETPSEISITYTKAKNRNDVILTAEWSTSLASDDWQAAGITTTVLVNGSDRQVLKSSLPIIPGDPQRFIRLKAVTATIP